MFRINFYFLLVFFLLFGCATLKGARVEEINNRKVEYVLQKGKSPAVIFENGLGGQLHWWAKIYPEIAKSQTTFAYNRPGYGESEVANSRRDGEIAIEELRENLRSLKIEPPYILVGHSLGGLYFQYYARRYPQEIAGLILVDSTHPEQLKGDGAVEKWPWWVRTVVKILTPKAGIEELDFVDRTGQAVLALPPLDTKRIRTVIMLASEPKNPTNALEKDVVFKRQNFHELYPGAEFVMVEGDHAIPLNSPESVVEQIKKVILKVENK